MTHPVITVEERPASREARARLWLRGRRFMLASLLALGEVIVYLVAQPGRLLGVVIVAGLLAAALVAGGRVRTGLARDLLLIVGLAQALVIALPILEGVVRLVVAAVLVLGVIALFVVIGLRFRK